MHQSAKGHTKQGFTLHEPTQQLVVTRAGIENRRRVWCDALRRPTAAQRGSKYYENYMRKRREKGGVFLGPPLQLPDSQLQLAEPRQYVQDQLQQQQQSVAALAVEHEQQVPATAVHVHGTAAEARQHQQQPELHTSSSRQTSSSTAPEVATLQPSNPNQAVPTSLDPGKFRQLLEDCMLATATRPIGLTQAPLQPNSLLQYQQLTGDLGASESSSHHQQQQQQQLGFRAQPLHSPTPQQYQQQPRQPWQFKDYVAPELAEGLVPELKRKGGHSIEPPLVQKGSRLLPLPQLPSSSTDSSSSSSGVSIADRSPASSSSNSSSGGSGTADRSPTSSSSSRRSRTRVLHVYWDISSAHPGGLDPRVVVAQLKHVLGSYGQIAGMYAYGVQKMFNWIPEAFMLEYAPERLPRGRSRRLALSRKQQQQQQQDQLEQQLQAATASGVDLDESLGPLRCPCCGKLRSNYQQLHLHMVQRHKQPAPPLSRLLPATALTAAAAAPAVNSQQVKVSSTWSPAEVKSIMNNSTRTLGRVARYYNSNGDLFVPPDSHQIGLKYVLLREGVEVRYVQNHKHAVDVTLAEGLHLLLEQLLQRDAASAQQYEDVVVVISDRGTHTSVLKRFQKAGFPVIAVCRRIKRYVGADITLRWQWVVNGRYDW